MTGPQDGRGDDREPEPGAKRGPGYALFVAQSTYRQRRMIDAAGLLPLLGAILFAMPLLWMGAEPGATEAEAAAQGAATSHVMIYLFAAWAGLVALSALVTRGLSTGPEPARDPPARER